MAGNLDIDEWTRLHALTPLKRSLNPADFAQKLETLPQTHLIGGKDNNMIKAVFFSFEARFSSTRNIRHRIYDAFDHSCCWHADWPGILKELGY